MGRQAANTKLGAKRIHEVRTRGGNRKFRAMRLDAGNFSWGSEAISRKTRIVAVVYNSSNNELVRTGTLVKNAVVQIDATPFRQWYEAHYATPIGARKAKGAAKVNNYLFFIAELTLSAFGRFQGISVVKQKLGYRRTEGCHRREANIMDAFGNNRTPEQ